MNNANCVVTFQPIIVGSVLYGIVSFVTHFTRQVGVTRRWASFNRSLRGRERVPLFVLRHSSGAVSGLQGFEVTSGHPIVAVRRIVAVRVFVFGVSRHVVSRQLFKESICFLLEDGRSIERVSRGAICQISSS